MPVIDHQPLSPKIKADVTLGGQGEQPPEKSAGFIYFGTGTDWDAQFRDMTQGIKTSRVTEFIAAQTGPSRAEVLPSLRGKGAADGAKLVI